MAHSTLNSKGMDTGSNYRFGDKLLKPQFPRSLFDLSHLSTMTIKNAGYVFPISLWRTVPSDEFDISVRSLIRVLPQKVPLYSRQRLYVYAFYSRNGDLWENWNTFIRKGLSGNTVKTIPALNVSNTNITSNVVCDSLADYMCLPIGAPAAAVKSGKLSALPYMMYMRIWRDYFFNHNFAVSGAPLSNTMEYLLPDNDDHFRLNDDGEIISFKEHNVTTSFELNDVGSLPTLDSSSGTDVFRFGLFPHLYPDDYFTSALPFQQRGTAPTIDLSLNSITGDITNGLRAGLQKNPNYNEDSLFAFLSTFSPESSMNYLSLGSLPFVAGNSSGSSYTVTDYNDKFNSWLTDNLIGNATTPYDPDYKNWRYGLSGRLELNNVDTGGLSITLNNIRELTISQLELERMARTDGSYAEFGQTFFGVMPKNAIDYKPVFIGGSYTGLSFTEVLQTSASDASSFLGQYAGHGIGADNDGYLGHIYCDDYGYIMILGCVMPDVYYHQGIDKHYTDLNQSQMLLPDRAKLGMQPILNQELYFQAYTVRDSDGNPVNENLFAYQDAFDDYRFMTNRIHGQIADKTKLSFFPYTQARDFDSLPNWSYEFAAATDVRKDYLAANIEDAYTAQFDINVRAVRPLPYQSVPMTFGV